MKKLQNCSKLNSKITVCVPATTGVNKATDNTEQVEKTAALLAECFGGSTYTPAVGCWMSDAVGLVRERTTVVYAYASSTAIEQHIDEVVDLCERLKDEMKQESIALELNGEMYFI